MGTWPRLLAAALSAVMLLGWAVVASAQDDDGSPLVVVTTEVLGSLVNELVGDAADVTVLMEAGSDPHTWQPSARDSEAVFRADLIVANGGGLEEGLAAVLDQASAQGILVFRAVEHTDAPGAADASPDPAADGTAEAAEATEATEEHGHDHGPVDPHIWLDPLAMRDVVLALAPALSAAGVEVADRAERLAGDLTALDAELAATLAGVPPERRRLVTGHGALGRFAERYGFEIVGSVVPGLSSADEPSARDIADLVEAIRETGVTAVFTDVTTPRSVADVVAAETGARIVPISVEQLPPSGRYADLVREIAATIASVLGA